MSDSKESQISAASEASISLSAEPVAVATLNENDVLFGRGTGSNQYIGNRRFHELVRQRKQDYHACRKHEPKRKIAIEVLNHIQSQGGRFLRRDNTQEAVEWSIEEGTWYVVDYKASLEKVKQALREREPDRAPDPSLLQSVSAELPMSPTSNAFGLSSGLPMILSSYAGSHARTTNLQVAKPTVTLSGDSPFAQNMVDLRLLLSHADPFAFCRGRSMLVAPDVTPGLSQVRLSDSRISEAHLDPPTIVATMRAAHHEEAARVQSQAHAIDGPMHSKVRSALLGHSVAPVQENSTIVVGAARAAAMPNEHPHVSAQEDDVSEFLLSVLALSGRTKFTEEQRAEERANMTNEERARVLADLFGKYCSSPQSKRARRDLDVDSIAFLVKEMKVEIEKTPIRKKEAFMEARQACRPDEFNDARLERFLRCVDMDVKLAAQRFINYWKCRKDVFGPEKYLLRMTLGEALRDDVVALESCIFSLLPQLDATGRQVHYMEPARHNGEGYTSASLLRAIWYMHEVASQSNNDRRSRVVQIVWVRNMTIWEYDAAIYDRMHHFETHAWPIRVCAFHVCCAPSFVHRILKPVLFALMDKESRSRIVFHDVAEGEICKALSPYGLSKDMLPTSMGGSLELDQREWLENRRAAELEEI